MADETWVTDRLSGAELSERNKVRPHCSKQVAIIDNKGWEGDRESRINWHSAMTDSYQVGCG